MSEMQPAAALPDASSADDRPPLSRQEWALLCSAYLSQFVASGFFFMAMTAILRERGANLEQIGWVYLLGIVPGLKFVWAPLMDRYGFGPRGHYSAWLALMQALLMATLLWLATLPMTADQPLPLAALLAGCTLVSLLTACQDIAADGLSCRLLGPAQRGLGNAMQLACGMLGWAVGGGGVLIMYGQWGWQPAILSLTALNAVTLALALLYREPPYARPVAPAGGHASLAAYARRLWGFWQQPGTGWRWFVLIATVNCGMCMAYSLMTPMLVDAGWSMEKIGLMTNVYGVALGTTAMLALGLAIKRWSAARALPWVMAAQALAVVALMGLLLAWSDGWALFFLAAFMMLCAPLEVLLSTLMMARASAGTPATDFSMQHGIYTVAGMVVGSALSLQLAGWLGYGPTLALALAASLIVCVTVPRLWHAADERARQAGVQY